MYKNLFFQPCVETNHVFKTCVVDASAAPCARGCPLWSPQVSDSLLREQACCGSRAELLLLALLLAFHQLALLGLQNPFRECYLAQALCVGLAFDRLGQLTRGHERSDQTAVSPAMLQSSQSALESRSQASACDPSAAVPRNTPSPWVHPF